MPLQIVQQDITKIRCDVIVNPTDSIFSGSGGTDLAIHEAAGSELAQACAKLDALDYGEAAATPGFGLDCSFIIHTFGPVWEGGGSCESTLLRSCYLNALILAIKLNAESIAFPLISSGTFGFPKDRVLRIAMEAISDFLDLLEEDLDVYICAYDRNAYELSEEVALKNFVARIDEHAVHLFEQVPDEKLSDLAKWIQSKEKCFGYLLMDLIRQKGITEVQCYKRSNVSRKTFSKICNEPKYRPSKETVLSFAIGLELTLEETEQLLKTVGFSLSGSEKRDRIVEFYIRNGCYKINEIDAALFQYGEKCLFNREV